MKTLNFFKMSVRVSLIAKKYARTLFTIAKNKNELDKISAELELFRKNFSNEIATELKNPVISKNNMTKIINQIIVQFKLGKITGSFFTSIVKNRRLNILPEIHFEFQRLLQDHKNILEAEVYSITNLNLDPIQKLLEKNYPNKKIVIKHSISKEILGGIQIRIGSKIIDASLKNQLEQIKKESIASIN